METQVRLCACVQSKKTGRAASQFGTGGELSIGCLGQTNLSRSLLSVLLYVCTCKIMRPFSLSCFTVLKEGRSLFFPAENDLHALEFVAAIYNEKKPLLRYQELSTVLRCFFCLVVK